MAKVPLYNINSLASSNVGTPGVNHAGDMIAQSISSGAGMMMDASIAGQRQLRGTQINNLENAMQGLGHFMRARNSQMNQLKNHQQNMADDTEAFNIITGIKQKHASLINGLSMPDTDYPLAIKNYPNAVQDLRDEMVGGKQLNPNVQALVEKGTQNLITQGLGHLETEQRKWFQSQAQAGIETNLENGRQAVKQSLGDPTLIAQQKNLLYEKESIGAIYNAYGPEVGKKKVAEQSNAITTTGWTSGLMDALDTDKIVKENKGNILAGNKAQGAKLQALRGYLNHPEYSDLPAKQLLEMSNRVNNELEANGRDRITAIHNSNTATVSKISDIATDGITARYSNSKQGVLNAVNQLKEISDKQRILPLDEQDLQLKENINRALVNMGAAQTAIENTGYSALSSNRSEDDRLVSIENQTKEAEVAAVGKGVALTNKRNDALYLKGSDARIDIKKYFDGMLTAYDSAKNGSKNIDAKGFVAGVDITAKDIRSLNNKIEDAYSEGYLKFSEREKHLVDLDKYRRAVTPSTMADRASLENDAFWHGELKIQSAGASPVVRDILQDPSDPASLGKINANWLINYDIEKKNLVANPKFDKGWNNAKLYAEAAERANHAVLEAWLKEGAHKKFKYEDITVKPEKIIRDASPIYRPVPEGFVPAGVSGRKANNKSGFVPPPPPGMAMLPERADGEYPEFIPPGMPSPKKKKKGK